jgi:hypothetical protein
MKIRLALAVIAATITLGVIGGCGGPARTAKSTPLATTSTEPTTTPPTSTTLPPQGLVLGPDGFGVVQAGDSQSSAVSTMTHYLGSPTSTTPGDCSGTTEVQWNDLSLEFSKGTLDGYRYLRGGLPAAGTEHPLSGTGNPLLKTATGATLRMTLTQVQLLYPAGDFSEEQGGSIVVAGTKSGDRLFLGFFENTPSTPLTEIKGGETCGDF